MRWTFHIHVYTLSDEIAKLKEFIFLETCYDCIVFVLFQSRRFGIQQKKHLTKSSSLSFRFMWEYIHTF